MKKITTIRQEVDRQEMQRLRNEVAGLRGTLRALGEELDARSALVERYRDAEYRAACAETRYSQSAEKALLSYLLREVDDWAGATFPQRTPESLSKHILKEAKELVENPSDPEEIADLFILLANLVGLLQYDPVKIISAKMAKNRLRVWGMPDADGVVEHVREKCPGCGISVEPHERSTRCP